MTDTTAASPRESPIGSLLRHSRHVLAENPVTGFAFALFLLIVLAAVFGPEIAPYDPLASNTVQALKPPSAQHWFGTDQLGRDVFSRVIVATRLDFFIAVASVALVFVMGGLAGVAAGFFAGWTDRIVGRIADTIMAFPLFVLAMGIVAALGNNVQNIVLATAIVNFPLYVRIARAEANVRREAGFVESTVDAQRRLYRLNPEPLQELDAWLAQFRRFWSTHLDALERHLDRIDSNPSTPKKGRMRKRRGPNREPNKGEGK